MSRVIIITLVLIFIVSCGEEKSKEEIPGRRLPVEAKNIKDYGKDWWVFEVNGSCFLFADHNRGSVMASIPCDK